MAWYSHTVAASTLGSFMQSQYGYDGLLTYDVAYSGTTGSVTVLVKTH